MEKERKRMTLKNPGKSSFSEATYRARALDVSFRLECQQGEIWIFGDLINALGRLEDEEELRGRNRT